MKIAFYIAKYGTKYDKAISFATNSPYSHCEIVLDSGECWSSSLRDGGVRGKFIDLSDHWDVFDIVGVFDVLAIQYWFLCNENDKYDWIGAFGSLIHVDATSENRKFCSYACAIVLGINPIITPGALYRILKKSGFIL